MNNKKIAALKRAEREKKDDPQKYIVLGRKGGLAKVPKGFAKNKEALLKAIKNRNK